MPTFTSEAEFHSYYKNELMKTLPSPSRSGDVYYQSGVINVPGLGDVTYSYTYYACNTLLNGLVWSPNHPRKVSF